MNYKNEILKLEKLVIDKKYQSKILRDDISKIESKIDEYSKLAKQNNNNSIIANDILCGKNRQDVAEVLLYMINTFSNFGTGRVKKCITNIDYKKAIQDELFFNELIVTFGKATIDNIFKHFENVTVDESGRSVIVYKSNKKRNPNLGNMIFSKLSKKSFEDFLIKYGYIK